MCACLVEFERSHKRRKNPVLFTTYMDIDPLYFSALCDGVILIIMRMYMGSVKTV